MKMLFITGFPVKPQLVGGAQLDADAVIRGLQRRGHAVALLAGLLPDGAFGSVARVRAKLSTTGWAKDKFLGYSTYRTWDVISKIPGVLKTYRPDVVIVLAKSPALVAQIVKSHGTPFAVALQDNEVQHVEGDFRRLGRFPAIANSKFTSDKYLETFGITSEVVYPLIEKERYRVTQPGNAITFINPHPLKGLAKFFEIASLMRDRAFLAVESWQMNEEAVGDFLKTAEGLPNVTLMRSTDDMKEVYSKTRLLLVPSQWNEGYGRVVTEAHVSGIPVIGSDRGGLPEAIGPGGRVLPADAPAAQWVDEIRAVVDDPAKFDHLSKASLQWANRPELEYHRQIDAWERLILGALDDAI